MPAVISDLGRKTAELRRAAEEEDNMFPAEPRVTEEGLKAERAEAESRF